MAKQPPVVYCILGMHRSGTSVAARILNILGVDLGPPDTMVEPAPENPKGFWEYEPFIRINQQLLRRLGGHHLHPPTLPPGWHRDRSLQDLRSEAAELARRDFGASATWAWKDPRASLTLPFWEECLPPMRYVVCFRNPLDVARSLELRDRLPRDRGLQLWATYLSAGILNTQGADRLFIAYEHIVTDWRTEVNRLASFLRLEADPLSAASTREVEGFVDQDLRHHASRPEDVLKGRGIPDAIRFMHVMLRCAARLHPGQDAEGAAGIALNDSLGDAARLEIAGRRSFSRRQIVRRVARKVRSRFVL